MAWPGVGRADEFPAAFVVSDVPVSATGKSGAAARDAARTAGQQAALQQVLRRLTAKADWPRLPMPDQDATTNLVQDFQVQKEHMAPTHYVGLYTFRFNPAGIRQLLQSAGLGFTELVSKPVVVVPLYTVQNITHLWDDPNPWRDAWNLANGRAGLVPWNVPLGDLGDVQVFDVAQAEAPKPADLAALSQRYGGGDPVIAAAVETDTPQNAALAITVTRYANGTSDSATASVTAPKPDAAFYAAGVEAARQALEEMWKKNALLPTLPSGNAQPFQVTVPIASARQWTEISDRLSHVDGVQDPEILMMSHDQVVLRVKLAADPQAMRLAFAQQDLMLTPSDSGATLQLSPQAAPPPSPAPGTPAAPLAIQAPLPAPAAPAPRSFLKPPPAPVAAPTPPAGQSLTPPSGSGIPVAPEDAGGGLQ